MDAPYLEMGSSRWRGVVFGLTLAISGEPLLSSCSSSGGSMSPPDGGGDAAPVPWTCAQIRTHALGTDCADDSCVASYEAMGTADAQAAFQALYDCTKNAGGCATPNVIVCVCNAQCYADSPCATELDACLLNAVTDPTICDSQCH